MSAALTGLILAVALICSGTSIRAHQEAQRLADELTTPVEVPR